MVHGKIVTAEWKNESGSGRIGSGESHSLPVSTQALLFFPSAVKIAPLTYFALRFTSWTPRRGCVVTRILDVKREGKVRRFIMKKGKEKYEISSILYTSYVTKK